MPRLQLKGPVTILKLRDCKTVSREATVWRREPKHSLYPLQKSYRQDSKRVRKACKEVGTRQTSEAEKCLSPFHLS